MEHRIHYSDTDGWALRIQPLTTAEFPWSDESRHHKKLLVTM